MATNINIGGNVEHLSIHEAPAKMPELKGIINRMGPLTSLIQAIVEAENYREFDSISPYLPGLEHVSIELDKLFGELLELSETAIR